MAQKKLFLVDAFAIIYRAYFAFGTNQRYNSAGLNTSTMLGFTNTLIDALVGVLSAAPSNNGNPK